VSGLHIRSYAPTDLDQLYEICLRTGNAGEDATELVGDPRLFGEVYAAPYGMLEPEHALVLDDGSGTAVGYVLGALDSRAFEARCEADWWPALRERHPKGSGANDLDELLIAMLHEPHLADDAVLQTHPSHLHIDLLPAAQGAGWGRHLMAALEDRLRTDGAPGVHLGVSRRNERALGFYLHLGYEELDADAFGRTLGLRLSG
jgi:ribosomal protein S18 acetylase RimI-like enzyme